MFTANELNYLYQILDQLNVRGEDQKNMILILMRKIRVMIGQIQIPPSDPGQPETPLPPGNRDKSAARPAAP